jgi:hypothetical protein
MSRPVLEHYLARSITMMDLLTGKGNPEDNIRMLVHIGAKFAGRVLYVWGTESRVPGLLAPARELAQRVHAADPEVILQAAVFEIITEDVRNVPVPEWVFREFGEPPVDRGFDYQAMLYADGTGRNQWSQGSSVPDMSRRETQMWFFYASAAYIDAGVEALHFGQVELMDKQDPGHKIWGDLLGRVRRYAAGKARRHLVLCDAHVPSGGLTLADGRLLFDVHSFPLRVHEVPGLPQQGRLAVGHSDGIYGRSRGGLTPSGWRCEHLPYLVELDNWSASGKEGQIIGDPWCWGYDEIGWFAHQSESYRNQWLGYAWHWLAEHDGNGFLQMPGSRCLAAPVGKLDWYFANTRSPAMPDGFNQEETIRAIWAGGTR